jgi:hypothetical protein
MRSEKANCNNSGWHRLDELRQALAFAQHGLGLGSNFGLKVALALSWIRRSGRPR